MEGLLCAWHCVKCFPTVSLSVPPATLQRGHHHPRFPDRAQQGAVLGQVHAAGKGQSWPSARTSPSLRASGQQGCPLSSPFFFQCEREKLHVAFGRSAWTLCIYLYGFEQNVWFICEVRDCNWSYFLKSRYLFCLTCSFHLWQPQKVSRRFLGLRHCFLLVLYQSLPQIGN